MLLITVSASYILYIGRTETIPWPISAYAEVVLSACRSPIFYSEKSSPCLWTPSKVQPLLKAPVQPQSPMSTPACSLLVLAFHCLQERMASTDLVMVSPHYHSPSQQMYSLEFRKQSFPSFYISHNTGYKNGAKNFFMNLILTLYILDQMMFTALKFH